MSAKQTTQKSEEEWRSELSKEEYAILRQKGTEPPFSGKYVEMDEEGKFMCGACGNPLFSSDTKFKSGTGWPSFYDVINEDSITIKKDRSMGMLRDEVVCAKCESHLGHIFKDGPEPTGKRYCINSVALDFERE